LSFGRGFVGSVRCPSVRLSADRLSAQGATPSITPSTTPSNALPPSTGQRVVVFVRTKTHLSWLTVSRREKKNRKKKRDLQKKKNENFIHLQARFKGRDACDSARKTPISPKNVEPQIEKKKKRKN